MTKVMEDVKVEYDGSVRNASGVIYSLIYYDGCDCGEMVNDGETVSFINLNEAVARVNAEFGF